MQSGPVSLPAINTPYCYSWKSSRKVSGKAQSHFYLEDAWGLPICDFEIEHDPKKQYPYGAFCKWVKKGFPLSVDAKLAIKKYDIDILPALKMAIRAAEFHKVIGETAIPFMDDRGVYLLMKYHEGNSLYALHEHGLLVLMPVIHRLNYAFDLLHQVMMMHELDCIHRDIKPDNVIINDAARLVDLDSAFMLGESRNIQGCTLSFLSAANQSLLAIHGTGATNNARIFNRQSDLHALSLTLCVLFSDLFDLKNYNEEVRLGRICEVNATVNAGGSRHPALTGFIFSLGAARNHQYASTRDVLAAFIAVCRATYQKDFSARVKSESHTTKQLLKAALDNISSAVLGYEDKITAYQSTPIYFSRRLNQPNARLVLDALCVPGMEKLLAKFDREDYARVFDNILRATRSLLELNQVLQLCRRTLPLIAWENKDKFVSSYREKLMPMHTIHALKIELHDEQDNARKVEIILAYLEMGQVDAVELCGPDLFPTLAKLPTDVLDNILNSAFEKNLAHNLPARIQASFGLVFQSSQLAPDMTMRLFYRYVYPLFKDISPQDPDLSLLENCLIPETEDHVFAIAEFFSHFDRVAAITRKMRLHFPVASELRVKIALTLPPGQCLEFYRDNIVSSDINKHNLISLVARLPAENRVDFLIEHERQLDIDAVKAHLTHDESNFLVAAQQIIAKIRSYKNEKLNLHDKRVEFIYRQVLSARSVAALVVILDSNNFDCPSGLAQQYSNHPPGHRLFSYGFSRLIRDCKAVLAGLSKEIIQGFVLL